MFDAFRHGTLIPLVSETLLDEIEEAPDRVRGLLDELLDLGVERLEAVKASYDLQEAYVLRGVISQSYASDALHVAQATLAKADVIVSWNFKHLVQPKRIRGYNTVNQQWQLDPIVIMTPLDLMQSLEENEDSDD